MKEYSESFEYEILKYVEGKKVSEEFLNTLNNDVSLQNEILMLKTDIYFMNNVKSSSLFNTVSNKSKIVINDKNEVSLESLFLFTPITALNARDLNNEKQKVYAYKNIELHIKKDSIFMIVNEIKNGLVILKDGKNIVNIKGSEKKYSSILEKGDYLIKFNDNEASILIK